MLSKKFEVMKRKVFLASILLFGAMAAAKADNAMTLSLYDGNTATWAVPAVRTLTFASGQMSINLADGTQQNIDVASVRKITFNTGGDDAVTKIAANKSVTVYPNPTTDFLHVSNADASEKVTVIGLDGRVWLTGAASESLFVGDLPAGFYIAKVGNTTVKFRKQ